MCVRIRKVREARTNAKKALVKPRSFYRACVFTCAGSAIPGRSLVFFTQSSWHVKRFLGTSVSTNKQKETRSTFLCGNVTVRTASPDLDAFTRTKSSQKIHDGVLFWLEDTARNSYLEFLLLHLTFIPLPSDTVSLHSQQSVCHWVRMCLRRLESALPLR